MPNKVFCYKCNKDVDVRIVDIHRVYKVRDEEVEIDDKDTFCIICGEQLFNFDIDTQTLETVSAIYKDKKGDRHKMFDAVE